jgi:hypothetical protein
LHITKKNEMSFRHCSAVSHTSRGVCHVGSILKDGRKAGICIRICRDWVPRLTPWFLTFSN